MFTPLLPFTRTDAIAAGVTDAKLRGPRYRQLFRGVHILTSVELTLTIWVRAALLALPRDAVASHLTALRLYGLEIRSTMPLHISTRSSTHTRQKNVRVHQRRAPFSTTLVSGLPVTSPNRTLIDIATKVNLVELITAAEWMIHRRMTSSESLAEYAVARHLDGVQAMRRVLGLIRESVESPRETIVRLMIVFARLPEPMCNQNIRDASGRFLARGDLVYGQFKIVVEYDGWHHERDGRQRQRDIVRREALEAEGWRLIIVTAEDLKSPKEVVHRVHQALVERGYKGAAPTYSIMWDRWFA